MSVKVGLRFCSKIAACGLLLGSLLPVSVQAQTVSWIRQLATSTTDISRRVATDSAGNVYISGVTVGALAGPNTAGSDAFLVKFDTTGAPVWRRQLGLLGPNVASNDVATDRFGNVYITGSTDGALAGVYQGKADAFVAKYNSSGTLEWKQQLGTSLDDVSGGVAVDSNGNVYISGSTDGALGGANQGERGCLAS